MIAKFEIIVTIPTSPGQEIEPEEVHAGLLQAISGNTSIGPPQWMKRAEIRVIPMSTKKSNGTT